MASKLKVDAELKDLFMIQTGAVGTFAMCTPGVAAKMLHYWNMHDELIEELKNLQQELNENGMTDAMARHRILIAKAEKL